MNTPAVGIPAIDALTIDSSSTPPKVSNEAPGE